LGLGDIQPLRRCTCVIKLERPAEGRVFEVSRALAGVADVEYAEPNFLMVRPEGPQPAR
jgi:hypothetical protein